MEIGSKEASLCNINYRPKSCKFNHMNIRLDTAVDNIEVAFV